MALKWNIADAPVLHIPGREVRHMVNGEVLGSKDMSLQVVDVQPGAVSKPGHTHRDCEEILYVVSGEGEILVDRTVYPLLPGDVILVPRETKHLTRNRGKVPLRLICVFSCPDVKEGIAYHPDLDYPQ